MYHLRRLTIVVLSVVILYFAVIALYRHLNPNTRKSAEQIEDAHWIATSQYWLDRQACRWLSLCGLAHYHPDPAAISWKNHERRGNGQEPMMLDGDDYAKYIDWKDIAGGGDRLRPGDWEGNVRVLKDVPSYVLDHAPLIHLYSKEQFWPSDIAEHLMHTAPYRNHTSMGMNNSQHNVYNLHDLNEKDSWRRLFMHSKTDVEKRPEWLGSAYNKPMPYPEEGEEEGANKTYTKFSAAKSPWYEKESWYDPLGPGRPKKSEPIASSPPPAEKLPHRPSRHELRSKTRRNPPVRYPGGYSPAPVILVMVDKGNGILDAFWFYFYSYNLGTTVFNIRFGNHVGDWEHSLVRFQNGIPKAIFFSAHSGGLAYSYDAVEKGRGAGKEGRPVLYSAHGSHAMYATPGKQPYVLPFGLLADVTDKGPLWDPSHNYLAYHFNTSITHDQDAWFISAQAMEDKLQPAASNPRAPLGWFWYLGHWGDKFYELADLRQWRFAGQYHYVNGPLGPRFKNLGRSKVCQSRGSCTIMESIAEGKKRSWVGRRKK